MLAIYKYIYPISVLCRWLVSVDVEDVYIDIKIFFFSIGIIKYLNCISELYY
jgi:hypothetical protein